MQKELQKKAFFFWNNYICIDSIKVIPINNRILVVGNQCVKKES